MIPIHPAATVMTIREHWEHGLQVLLLKRNKKLQFAPDYWVFPGGRLDAVDGRLDSDSIESTARVAAVREASEEAGLELQSHDLHHYCHWTTPEGGKKRFGTWFFHCKLENSNFDVAIDNSEIVEYKWIRPEDALNDMSSGTIPLLPPTFISLQRIKGCISYSDVVAEFERTGIVIAEPVTTIVDGLFYCFYKGDAGYVNKDVSSQGARHRLVIDLISQKHQFEYENCLDYPPVNGGRIF